MVTREKVFGGESGGRGNVRETESVEKWTGNVWRERGWVCNRVVEATYVVFR